MSSGSGVVLLFLGDLGVVVVCGDLVVGLMVGGEVFFFFFTVPVTGVKEFR